ncbi:MULTISPECIES: AlkZ-related protein [unclassified Kribbella]|uniref:AlkZ-related protein n=1 Tax=unclassified Kribbella TaxID=2644121 RepID=UPI00301A4190
MTELGQARATRWWVRGRRIGSIERAGAFVDDVGFALLFPAPRAVVPSLWEAVAGEDAEPFGAGMGKNEQRVWTWKDELPRRGLAWYGAYLGGRGTFLSPELLRALYPAAGDPSDHQSLQLSPAAHEIAKAITDEPLPSATLRALIGDKSRYQRAITELQRNLLVTNAGVHESGSGWPAAVIALTCELFDVGGGTDHAFATERFLDTMLETTPGELGRAYRWPVPQARAHLNELVDDGRATFDGTRYRGPLDGAR